MTVRKQESEIYSQTYPRIRWQRSQGPRWHLFIVLTLFLAILLSLELWGSTASIQHLRAIFPLSRHQDDSFETFKHLGHLSPFFVPPNTPASLRSGAPPGCAVERVFLIHRHGSRHPHEDELAIIQNLSDYMNDNRDLFSNPLVKLPDAYSFLSEGWNSTFGTDSLTAPGRQQLFDHGVALQLQYPDFDNVTEVLASDSDRVVESARWFMDGYYGRVSNDTATLNVMPENETTVSWITPYLACPKWDSDYGEVSPAKWRQIYLPPITERINKSLAKAYPGINFTDSHTSAMLYSCAYETAIRGIGSSPWCDVFLPSEIADNEYEYDLRMRGFAGYGLPGDMAPVLGSLLVSNMTNFLQREEEPNLSLSFGHDKTIALGLTALGLASHELPPTGPVDPDRAWRAAKLMPFAATMVWQRLDCDGDRRIQLILNGANYGLGPVGCDIDNYGSCAFGDFLNTPKVQAALKCTHGDERWKAACH